VEEFLPRTITSNEAALPGLRGHHTSEAAEYSIGEERSNRMSMAATYRAVMLTKKGGPEALQVVELPIESPGPGKLRVQVHAAGVGSTDLIMLGGGYPFAPKIPFVPGYEVAGVVEAIGPDATGFELGQRVAAFTVYGGFAELLVREAEHSFRSRTASLIKMWPQ
jgi:NADPH:quinone reductase-like Zn-dependent oxidoreductase